MIKLLKKLIWLGLLGVLMVVLMKNYQAGLLEGPEAPAPTSWVEWEDAVPNEETPTETANSLNIDMPFFTQAPHSNWDYPWQEACEEASVLLVANLYQDLQFDTETYNRALLDLVDWEMATFGAYEHTTVAQTLQMMEENYGLEGVVHEDPSFEDIQAILNRGNLIIAPFAGKLLGNPNYKNGGPLYHMMVIKGYDIEKNQIVTHDVGTRNGADYVYDWAIIELALHDWHDTDMLQGVPRIIEVIRPQ